MSQLINGGRLIYREHDKDPDTFFSVICDLKAAGFQFVVSVIGQVFNEVPGESYDAHESII